VVLGAEDGAALDDNPTFQNGPSPDLHPCFHDSEGADADIGCDFGLVADDCRGMDIHKGASRWFRDDFCKWYRLKRQLWFNVMR